ncbi:mitogen-activated protein kinase kinase kinase [Coemansia asiatica]|uniref:Mitogen-activated protein kinase kinase kinase n=1 Tax=Coemansia asiatica TaxID=1052880 RepID=A0A9W7XPH8_9FUNG|nr:mitogen-activated protein kinase kinase kinase [Coemansia asiatica]
MDGRSGRRDAHDSGSATGSAPPYPPNLRFPLATPEAQQQSFNLSSISIPVDSAGNPLPWSRDSIIQWARQNGFKKFIPAFIQHGIEGYRFYMLKLEEMREMKIPNVTMQDLIQLNAAIYRLNVACASPANRSHMTGTLRTPTLNTPTPPPPPQAPHQQQQQQQQHQQQYRPAKSVTDSSMHTVSTTQYLLPPSSSQILSRPLQPLRPPRPSWTLRRDDPQPTYVRQQVQLTSNGIVARPVRIRPQSQQQQQQQPSEPSQLHRSPQPAPSASPPVPSSVPFSINTSSAIPVPHSHNHHQQKQQQQQQQMGHQITRANGLSPHSPFQESPVVQSGERIQRFNNVPGAPKLVHHPEIDDLHALRASQATWSANTQAAIQQRPPGIHALPQQPTHYIVQRIPHMTNSSMTVPVRYHGSNQPYAFYYAPGTSAPVNAAYIYHGASNAPNTLRLSSRSFDTSADDATYVGTASNRPNQQHSLQQRPPNTAHYQTRPGIRGMFANETSSPEASRSHPSRDSLAIRPAKTNGSVSMRRTSLSPVLTALKPGNYHIANLPDHDLDDSSDTSDSSANSQQAIRSQMIHAHNCEQQQQQQPQTVSKNNLIGGRPGLPAAINTSLLHADLRHDAGQCDTGDSTITPLSVVNMLRPGLHNFVPGYFGQTNHTSDESHADGNFNRTELSGKNSKDKDEGSTVSDEDMANPIDELPSVTLREITTGIMVLDAESIDGGSDQEDPISSAVADEHFDLVENAADIDSKAKRPVDGSELLVFDAEEIDDTRDLADSIMVLDAEEIDGSDEDEQESSSAPMIFDADELENGESFNDGSSVVVDAYETESIFSAGDHQNHQSADTQQKQQIISAPVLPPPIITASISKQSDLLDSSDKQQPLTSQQQQHQSKSADSEAFKVKGVRHVVSYGSDFDKTAATLLSSIKDDIARKAAAGIVSPGAFGSSGKPLPTAASIAAAIEHHQQKQQQKQSKPATTTATVAAVTEDEPLAETPQSQTHSKHTGRFSGLFGFGPRSQKHAAPPPSSSSASGGGGVSGSLRVVTDFQSLRNASSGSLGINEAPSSDGKKSASPSTVSKRWRVPFRQLKSSNVSATTAESASLQSATLSAKPADDSADMTVVSGTSRIVRRSRYRAGTTSDIESPQTAAKVLSATVGERPYSMVENSTSSSSGAVTPTRRLFRQQQNQNPGISSVAVRRSRVIQESLSPVHTRVRFQGSREHGRGEAGAAAGGSTSGSESEISSANPMSRSRRSLQTLAAMGNNGSSLNSPATESEAGSFFTAGSPTSMDPKPLEKADSWTLMFFNKEFVVQPSSLSTGASSNSTAPTDETALEQHPAAETFMESPLSATELYNDSDGDEQYYPEDPQQMSASIENNSLDDCDADDAKSVASSTRTLPSTMRFTRGMRATLLERRPSQNIRGRPTADVIGEQLDEYFPDHDLDKPIVQSVVLSHGSSVLAPDHKYHIIVSEDESSGTATMSTMGTPQQDSQQRQLAEQTPSDSPEDPARENAEKSYLVDAAVIGGGYDGAGNMRAMMPPAIGRRKSVRMLVQETRQKRRRQYRARTPMLGSPEALDHETTHLPSLPTGATAGRDQISDKAGSPSPENNSESSPSSVLHGAAGNKSHVLPPPILRRKSTKLWGCIPEEIRPINHPSRGRSNGDIVRRALSLLRKPEPDPQAEKDIVEAAIKCGDSSSIGSTRAHFVTERAKQQQQQQQQQQKKASEDAAGDVLAEIQLRAITIQWIKGKLIGKGSFGNVHVAINAATGEVIAVKQIKLPKSICALNKGVGSQRDKDQWEEAISMMYTEVELLKDLDHENIVQLLGFEIVGGVMSMFLEYVPGGTVQSLVQQHGPLPESVVHSFLRQILAGLAYLHERSILHRDIKGANILVDETGTCKISDFGVSRRTDHSSLVALFRNAPKSHGKIIGTVPFMAPEVARGSRYTEAADIWSLGCVVVQMWSGRPPWDELQEPQVFFKLGRGQAPPIPDDLTEHGLEFCKNCFAADPAQRWSAGQLACMDFALVPGDYEYPYAIPASGGHWP